MARVFIDTSELEAAVQIRESVEAEGHDIEMVESSREVENRLREGEDEIVLALTGDLGERRAREMLAHFDGRIPRPPVIGFVAEEDPEERGRLARQGGIDQCLELPPDTEEVQVVVEGELERFRLQRETGIIGRTPAVREVLDRIRLIAPVKSTVLLTGESGTGKELAARALHHFSPRRGKSFIVANCAALPESLLESELFGHEKGAFTGATSRRQGMFELADGGTIFLDEIAEMPPSLQTRLLRVLEQRRFMRVGGESEIEVNVRVIAATNRNLSWEVRGGNFRRDLYYRLNVVNIDLPPLRERKRDIPVLVRYFVQEFSDEHGREFKGLSSDAMEILMDYDWPGNVRELRNLVESMVVLAPGSLIRAEDIPSEIRSGAGGLPAPAGRGREPAAEADRDGAGEVRQLPEMEFVFQTLIELKMDLEDLRREFARYKEEHPELIEAEVGRARAGAEIEIPALSAAEADGADEEAEEDDEEGEEPTIEFHPGMTMDDLEREAIVATLKEVGGNRRKAAETLGIGERTLYRKLREYDIDL